MAAGAEYRIPDPRSVLNARFHAPLMSFFLRRVGNRNDAEDLTQEVLIRVLAAAEPGRIKHADAFIFKVAANLLRDRQRQWARRRGESLLPIDGATVAEFENELIEELSPERVLLGRDMLADVLRTLDELGDRTRDIYVLFRIERMKHKEIAAIYGIAVSTVEKHVNKAGLHLAVRYGERWICPGGGDGT